MTQQSAKTPAAVRVAVTPVLVLFLCLLAPTAETSERLDGPVQARVVEVVDGDTLLVRARIWLGQEVETRVRLSGVDAPELRSRCEYERVLAEQARDFILNHIGDGPVVLHDVRYGKYAGRVLARIEDAGGMDLGRSLLAAGLARAGGRRGSWCEAVVHRAVDRRGILTPLVG